MSTDVDFIFHEFKTIMASYDVHCFIIQDKEIPPFSVTTNSAIQSFTTCYQEEEREENDNNHITTAIQEQNVENNQKKNDNSEPTRSRSSSITTANNNRNVWEFLQCVERESIKKRNRVQKLVRTHNRQHYQERRLRWEHSSCASGSTGERHRSSYYHSPIKSDEKESSTLATLLRIADDDNKTKNYDYTRRDIWKFLDKVKLETSRKKDRAYQLANNTDYCCYHHQPPPPPPDNSKAVGRLDAFLTSCCPWDKLRQITVTTVDSDSSSRRSSFSSFGSSSSFDEKEYLSSYYDGGSIESDNNSGSENGSNNTERSQIFSPSIIL